MAISGLLILGMTCLSVWASSNSPSRRNTIFLDEKLEGQVFESLDSIQNVEYNAPADFRLPKTTRPILYNILLTIAMDTFRFEGIVEIAIAASQQDVSEIVLHSHDLYIASAVLQLGAQQIPVSYELQPELQFLKLKLHTGVLQFNESNPVIYNLIISFNADIRQDMVGLYRSWFRNNPNNTEVSWLATTHFQATAARMAFPCYDEPSFKATFNIIIRRPVGYRSWSVTNSVTSSVDNYFEEDKYDTTPIMSTYLLAIIVGQYESIKKIQDGQLKYEVIARDAALNSNQGLYALETGEKLVQEMNAYTNINFFDMHPNMKMTHAAIPDFSAGAMENWGLIIYREAYLIFDPENTNDFYKQSIATIISHEVAHMWFGNLVTCEFWDNLWLNEGFARYYQYFLTEKVESEMGFETRFITERLHTALLADSVESAHPLTNPNIGNPVSIRGMFTTISYNKGAAIIRMTEHLLGSSVHTEGLRIYLSRREFDVARPIDLFESLESAAREANAFSEYGNFSLIEYYQSWSEQSGHPILRVQVNHISGDMIITQHRFNINNGYAENNLNYIIPITFASAVKADFENLKPSHIIKDAATIINRGSQGDHWVIFNNQQTGYYRVDYDDYTWDLIVMALRGPHRTIIHEYNRAQIVDDVFQFARSGLMSYVKAFNILSFLENETDYAPWVTAMTGFNWLRNRLAGTRLLTHLETIMYQWSQNVMNELTYFPLTNDTFMSSYLRYELAPVLCSINVADCRAAATVQFRALVVNDTAVTVNSRNWVYCNGLRSGSESDFGYLWQRYVTFNVYTEKIILLQNLGCTPHRDSLYFLLDNIFDENYIIRSQDYSTAFNGVVAGNEENTQIVFDYIKNNLQKVLNAFGSASPLETVASRLRNVEEVNEFQIWANSSRAELGSYYQTVINSANSALESIQWVDTISEDLSIYFETGDTTVAYSSSSATAQPTPVTQIPPPLVEPVLAPSSSVTSVLSLAVVLIVLTVNII